MYYSGGILNLKGHDIVSSELSNAFSNDKNTVIKGQGNFKFFFSRSKKYQGIFAPIYKQDKNVTVILEGRIFDDEINAKKQKGSSFQLKYIIELYNKYGWQGLSKLKGSFALALYDQKKRQLFLLRDKYGKKPFYYSIKNHKIKFSSSIDILLKLPGVSRDINIDKFLYIYYLHGLTQGNDTEFIDINSIEPGYILVFDKRGLMKRKMIYTDSYSIDSMTSDDVADKLLSITQKEIKKYTDILGSCSLAFSGGIDSSMILLSASNSGVPLSTFTLKYKTNNKAKLEDIAQARKNARTLKTEHHQLDINSEKFISLIDELSGKSERPLSLMSLNYAILFNWVSKHESSLFCGDGIEDQLGMYPGNASRYAVLIDRLLFSLRRNDYNKQYVLAKQHYLNLFINNSPHSVVDFKKHAQLVFNKKYQDKFSVRKLKNLFNSCWDDTEDTAIYLNPISEEKKDYLSFLNKVLELRMKNFFIPNKLNHLDHVAKTYNLDFISPFADSDFVDFTRLLPSTYKTTGESYQQMKIIFRQIVQKYNNNKLKFTTENAGGNFPLPEWTVTTIFERYAKAVLSEKRIKRAGIFKYNYVNKILKEHFHIKTLVKNLESSRSLKLGYDHSHEILKIMGIQLWYENKFGK